MAFARNLMLGAVVAGGLFAQPARLTIVSSASFDRVAPVAPDSLATIFGDGWSAASGGIVTADGPDLADELAGVSVKVTDARGVERGTRLVAVAPNQINLVVPADQPAGAATVRVMLQGREVASGAVTVANVSPALFSAGASGSGLAAATVTRPSSNASGVAGSTPLDPSKEPLYLSLFGTGLRRGASFRVAIGGVDVPVLYAGSQNQFPGLDQVNVGPLPASLAGKGFANVALTADDKAANRVRIAFTPDPTPVTFSNQISRIFQEKCQECHRPGEVAPFSLMDYASARPWARSIKSEVLQGTMPPWKPVAGHGTFRNERRLTQEQIDSIVRWVDDGAPEGDRAGLPVPRDFPTGWTLAQPDTVVEMAQTYTPVAGGADDYRCFSMPAGLAGDRGVAGVEVQPGNRKIVHHVILFADLDGVSANIKSKDGRAGYECFGGPGFETGDNDGDYAEILGAWAPGTRPLQLPDGTAMKMKAGSRLVIQVHYFPDKVEQSDRTRIGLTYSKHPNPETVYVLPLENDAFTIPAGAARHSVSKEFTVEGPAELKILALLPHMHLLGREIRADKIARDGTTTPLIYIDNWEFQWQDTYFPVDPPLVGSGEKVRIEGIYDNSPNNKNNPNSPPKVVTYGERTVDEMCLVIVFATVRLLGGQ